MISGAFLLDNLFKTIDNFIEKLNKGIELTRKDINKNDIKISNLHDKNTKSSKAIERAQKYIEILDVKNIEKE